MICETSTTAFVQGWMGRQLPRLFPHVPSPIQAQHLPERLVRCQRQRYQLRRSSKRDEARVYDCGGSDRGVPAGRTPVRQPRRWPSARANRWGAKGRAAGFGHWAGGFAVNALMRVRGECVMSGHVNWSRIASRNRMRRQGVEAQLTTALPSPGRRQSRWLRTADGFAVLNSARRGCEF